MDKNVFLLTLIGALFGAPLLRGDSASGALASYAASLKDKFPGVATITTKELAALDPPPLLLDVRVEKEFAVSHLAGAIRAEDDPLRQLQRLGVKRDTPIVVYCAIGYRSTMLAEKLQADGFTHIRNLEGSIFAWANEGRPIIDADGPAPGVHPFNILWGRYLEKSKWRWKPNGSSPRE
jgi:rhodanese-related sulfurtransferase